MLGLPEGSQEALVVDRQLAIKVGLLERDAPAASVDQVVGDEAWDAPLPAPSFDPFAEVPEELRRLG